MIPEDDERKAQHEQDQSAKVDPQILAAISEDLLTRLAERMASEDIVE